MLGFDAIGTLALGQQTASIITPAVGTATGTGTATATGRAVKPAAGATSGLGTASAVGFSFFAAIGLSSGIGAGGATGRSTFSGIASATGLGTASGTGRSTAASAGAASGLGAAAAIGTGIKAAVGNATGTGNATASAIAFGTGNGAAAGSGAATATGTAIITAVGAANGLGAANGVGTRVMPGAGAAAATGSAIAYSFYFSSTASVLKPDADDTDGGWLNEVGGTTLVPSIDETTPADSDYIISSDRPASDICKLSLSNPSGGISAPLAVFYRYGKQGKSTINLRVRLLEGTTEIAAWDHLNVTEQFVTANQVLTAPQFAAISDPTNLFLELRASV